MITLPFLVAVSVPAGRQKYKAIRSPSRIYKLTILSMEFLFLCQLCHLIFIFTLNKSNTWNWNKFTVSISKGFRGIVDNDLIIRSGK